MKNLISIALVVILCATILLGMSSLVLATTTGNSLPDLSDISNSPTVSGSTYASSFATSVLQFLDTPSFTNLAGDTISTLSPESSFVVDVRIENVSSESKTFYLIATLCEGTITDYIVTNISYMKKTLVSGETSDFGAGFNLPPDTASSFVKIYAWDKLIGGTLLAEEIMFP